MFETIAALVIFLFPLAYSPGPGTYSLPPMVPGSGFGRRCLPMRVIIWRHGW